MAAFLVSVVMLWLTVWRAEDEPIPEHDEEEQNGPNGDDQPQPAAVGAGRLAIAVFVALTVWLLVATATSGPSGFSPEIVVPAAILAIFLTTVLVGGQEREADEEVTAAIEEEQPHARREVLRELGWLMPSLVAGVAAYVAVAHWSAAGAAWERLAQWSPGGGFCPVGGAVYAIWGAVVGAAAGWVLRIVFTLVFGREAMGVGDIYILAAAGAAAGWDIALLGLLLAVGFALAAYVLSLLLKRTVIIPFGPWLAIGFVTALWLNKPADGQVRLYTDELTRTWHLRPDMCMIASGLMLVGSAAAVVIAKLARRMVERADK